MVSSPYALYGAGALFDATNGGIFVGYGRIGITFDTKVVNIPKGNWSATEIRKALIGGISGSCQWHYTESDQLATLTGGSTSTGAGCGITPNKDESGTVPAAPAYTVTLTNAATCIDASIGDRSIYTVVSGVKTYFEIVTAGAEAAGKCSVASGVLTFAVADASKVIYTTYLSTNATGTKVTIGPQDNASKFVGYAVIEGVKETTGASDYVTFYGLKCEWTGPFTLGADREGHEAISRDFHMNNDAEGDIIVYFG